MNCRLFDWHANDTDWYCEVGRIELPMPPEIGTFVVLDNCEVGYAWRVCQSTIHLHVDDGTPCAEVFVTYEKHERDREPCRIRYRWIG